jgi:hypothetical protein
MSVCTSHCLKPAKAWSVQPRGGQPVSSAMVVCPFAGRNECGNASITRARNVPTTGEPTEPRRAFRIARQDVGGAECLQVALMVKKCARIRVGDADGTVVAVRDGQSRAASPSFPAANGRACRPALASIKKGRRALPSQWPNWRLPRHAHLVIGSTTSVPGSGQWRLRAHVHRPR